MMHLGSAKCDTIFRSNKIMTMTKTTQKASITVQFLGILFKSAWDIMRMEKGLMLILFGCRC